MNLFIMRVVLKMWRPFKLSVMVFSWPVRMCRKAIALPSAWAFVAVTVKVLCYRKNSKIWDTSNNCHNCPKIEKFDITLH